MRIPTLVYVLPHFTEYLLIIYADVRLVSLLYDHTLCTPLFVLFSFPRIWCSCFTKRAIIIIIELWRLVWWEKPHGLVRTRHWIYKFLKINVAVLCPCYFQKNRGLPPYSPSVLQIVNFIYCSTWKQRKPVAFFVHHSLLSRLKQNARKKKKLRPQFARLTFQVHERGISHLSLSFPYFKQRLASHSSSFNWDCNHLMTGRSIRHR